MLGSVGIAEKINISRSRKRTNVKQQVCASSKWWRRGPVCEIEEREGGTLTPAIGGEYFRGLAPRGLLLERAFRWAPGIMF